MWKEYLGKKRLQLGRMKALALRSYYFECIVGIDVSDSKPFSN
jgi:hypothetical protein